LFKYHFSIFSVTIFFFLNSKINFIHRQTNPIDDMLSRATRSYVLLIYFHPIFQLYDTSISYMFISLNFLMKHDKNMFFVVVVSLSQ